MSRLASRRRSSRTTDSAPKPAPITVTERGPEAVIVMSTLATSNYSDPNSFQLHAQRIDHFDADRNALPHTLSHRAVRLELPEHAIQMRQRSGGHTQRQYRLDPQHPQAAFRIATDFSVNIATQGLRRLLEFSQSEQQGIRQAVSHRRRQKLHRRRALPRAQRRWLIAHDVRNLATEMNVKLVVLLLMELNVDAGLTHGIS